MRICRLLTVVALLLIGLTGAAAAHPFGHKNSIEGSGEVETRSFDLDEFSQISIGGSFEVDISFGDKQSLDVSIDDNLWDNLVLKVKGDRLIVDWDESCRPDDDCRLEIVVRSLTDLAVSGAADATVSGFEGESFRFNLSGAAELEMDGVVENLDIQVSGAGEIDTRNLQAQHVKVRISGAGNANITATESLDAEVSGVANIDYWGDPGKKRTSVSGMGSINSK